jgi:hypothetical protein
MSKQTSPATHIFEGLMGVSEILTVVVARGTVLIFLSMDTPMMRRLHGQPFNKQYREARATDLATQVICQSLYTKEQPEKLMFSSLGSNILVCSDMEDNGCEEGTYLGHILSHTPSYRFLDEGHSESHPFVQDFRQCYRS